MRLIFSVLLLGAFLSVAAAAETRFYASKDIEHSWSFTALGDTTTIETGQCNRGTTVAITDSTDSSFTQVFSCVSGSDSDSDCAATVSIGGATSPTPIGVSHPHNFLRLRVDTGPDSGTPTVAIVCSKEDLLTTTELEGELAPQRAVSVYVAGENGIEDTANPNTTPVVCLDTDGLCFFKANDGDWWVNTATNGVSTSTWGQINP